MRARERASRGEVQLRDIALREPNWPPRTTQIANAYHNQLELPVLFYVLTILADHRRARPICCSCCWPGCSSCCASSTPTSTSTDNHVPRRGLAVPGLSAIVLPIMWVIFMLRILLGF